nr:hypothetical protein [Tanacetum cinerariifolium]
FAVHADFANAAGDQLGVLGTEVQNQDAVGVNVEGHERTLDRAASSLKLQAARCWGPHIRSGSPKGSAATDRL